MSSASRPSRSLGVVERLDLDALGRVPCLHVRCREASSECGGRSADPSRDLPRERPAAARRSSSGRSCQRLPACDSGSRSRRRRGGRSRRPTRGSTRSRPRSPASRPPRGARRRPRSPTRRTPRRCRPGRPRRWPSYAAIRSSTPPAAPATVDGDAAGGQQVGREAGARGVRGDRAERRQEDVSLRRLADAAPRTRRRSGRTRLRRRGHRIGQVRELAEPGQRAATVCDVVLAPCPHLRHTPASNASSPSASIRPSSVHAAPAQVVGEASRRRTPHRPGRSTRATWDSSTSRAEMLRAIRRPNASGLTESARRTAPPSPRRHRRHRRRTRPRSCAAG